jgi:hypothetical protein
VLQGNLSIPSEQTDLSETGAPHSKTTINTIQADLYFEPADGHGKWRLLCSGICLRDLARNEAPSEHVLKILEYAFMTSLWSSAEECLYTHRELSEGCFSEANQKRLTRESPIEIYRARLPGSVRLVVRCFLYVSCVNDPDTSIKVSY